MNDSMSDYYAVLGLPKGASTEDVRAAYRRLAKQFHPDAKGGDANRFHTITHAYEGLRETISKPISGSRRTLVSGFWKAAKAKPAKPQEGAHVEAVLRLSLEDALSGAVRRVTLPGGRGLDVRCPAGCTSNDVIRLKGAGDAGRDGGKAGDALITIQLLAHKRAILKGRDLHLPLWLDLAQLRAGGKVEVSTPHGPIKVSVPPLSSAGQSLRLKSLGLPAYGKNVAGHLFFTLKARANPGFASALGRFSRIWANPLRSPVQPEA